MRREGKKCKNEKRSVGVEDSDNKGTMFHPIFSETLAHRWHAMSISEIDHDIDEVTTSSIGVITVMIMDGLGFHNDREKLKRLTGVRGGG
jgi:hypothetical protein